MTRGRVPPPRRASAAFRESARELGQRSALPPRHACLVRERGALGASSSNARARHPRRARSRRACRWSAPGPTGRPCAGGSRRSRSTSSRARSRSPRRIAVIPRRWRSTARPCSSSSSLEEREALLPHLPRRPRSRPRCPASSRTRAVHGRGAQAPRTRLRDARRAARTNGCPRSGRRASTAARARSRSRARARSSSLRTAQARAPRKLSCSANRDVEPLSARTSSSRVQIRLLRDREEVARHAADAPRRRRELRRAARPRTRGSCRASRGARSPSGGRRLLTTSDSSVVEVGVADGLRRLEREASPEHRELPEELLLVRLEQLVAPLDRRAQRSLPRRSVARARREQRQPPVEPREQLVRIEQRDACRRELDRERKPVEPPADLADGCRRVGSAGRPRARARRRGPRRRRRATARPGTAAPTRRAAARGS